MVAAPLKYSPARWDGQRVRFGDLASRCTNPALSGVHRLDPYYGGMWMQGSSAVWMSKELATTQVAAGLARMPKSLDMSTDAARRAVRSGTHFGARMAALGVVDQWRTVSAEQLAAFTGWPHLGSSDPKSMVSLFSLGVVDRGTFASALLPGASADRATLYRPSRSGAFEEEIEPLLSYEQKVAVTGGKPWDFRRQYDRHNLLTSELALRVAEWCEVGTVVGEKLSTVDLLAGTGVGLDEIVEDRSADMTVVRGDGLRIAVELTASAGPDFRDKVRRWARLLADRSLDSTGLMVLFVEAAPHDGGFRYGAGPAVRSQVYKAVSQVVREFPGSGRDRVAERIGVVSWSQWFPAAGMASREFTMLEVDRPTGGAQDRWERAALLDVMDVPFWPTDESALTAVMDNCAGLLGTPFWLRAGRSAPPLWPVSTSDVGWGELPVPPASRPTRFSGSRPDRVRGVAGVTLPAKRSRVDCAAPKDGARRVASAPSGVRGVPVVVGGDW